MSANRYLYTVIALVLAVAAVLTAYNAGATSALSKATGAYDLVKQVRSDRDAAGVKSLYADEQIPGSALGPSYTLHIRPAADSTYDRLEELRISRFAAAGSADAANNGWIERIEEIRLTRTVK